MSVDDDVLGLGDVVGLGGTLELGGGVMVAGGVLGGGVYTGAVAGETGAEEAGVLAGASVCAGAVGPAD